MILLLLQQSICTPSVLLLLIQQMILAITRGLSQPIAAAKCVDTLRLAISLSLLSEDIRDVFQVGIVSTPLFSIGFARFKAGSIMRSATSVLTYDYDILYHIIGSFQSKVVAIQNTALSKCTVSLERV
jgi:hypothetical protein